MCVGLRFSRNGCKAGGGSEYGAGGVEEEEEEEEEAFEGMVGMVLVDCVGEELLGLEAGLARRFVDDLAMVVLEYVFSQIKHRTQSLPPSCREIIFINCVGKVSESLTL